MKKLGIPPEQIDPLRYTGPRAHLTPCTEARRRPTTLDRSFPLLSLWRVQSNPSTGSEGEVWQLVKFDGSGDAIWQMISYTASGTPTLQNTVDAISGSGVNPVVPDGTGNIAVLGNAVAAHSVPVETHSRAANQFNIDVQAASAVNGDPGDFDDNGMCTFDDTKFTVSSTGYVSLIGGGTQPVESIAVDAATGPGVSPVVPTAGGLVTVQGAVVAAHSVPVETRSRAVNEYNLEIQLASDRTGAPSNSNDAGLSSYDDTQFVVDANGYVSLIGSGGGPPTLGLIGDTPSTNVPDGAGFITITGDTVANGSNAKPVFFDDTAASASTIDVQVATAIAGAPGDKLDAGLASFKSSDFTVDTDGFVELVTPGGGGSGGTPTDIDYFEDFWGLSSTWISIATDQSHLGVLSFTKNSSLYSTASKNILGGTEITLQFFVRLSTITSKADEYRKIGYFNSGGSAVNTDQIVFWFGNNLPNWYTKTEASSTETLVDTGVALTNDWVTLKMVINAAISSIEFFIDGVSVGTHITNIPTLTTLYLGIGYEGSAVNKSSVLLIDWLRFQQTRGT